MMLGTLGTLCTDKLFDWLMPFPTQTLIRALKSLHGLSALVVVILGVLAN